MLTRRGVLGSSHERGAPIRQPATEWPDSIFMLFIIGLGLYDEQDITVRGLAAVKRCKRVFLEAYTSILLVDKEKLVCLSSCL